MNKLRKKNYLSLLIKFNNHTIGIRMKDEVGCVANTPAVAIFQGTEGDGDVEP